MDCHSQDVQALCPAAVCDMGQLAAPVLKAEFAQRPISSSVTLQRALPQVQNY